MMIFLKSPKEIETMQAGGKIAAEALARVLSAVRVGVTTLELNQVAEKAILAQKAEPSFKTVDGYEFATCINVNSGIVHGLPNEYKIQKGDVVSVDLGAFFGGLHTDLSYTVEVETVDNAEFLAAGKKALEEGIKNFVIGGHIGDVSAAMQREIERHGYSVSRDLVGHGVGRELHEDPYVPSYGKKGSGPVIREGMVVAIEVIYQKGNPKIKVLEDGWTIATADGSLSALFEHTVAATKNGPLILTKG